MRNPLREMEFGAVLGTQQFTEWFRETFLDPKDKGTVAYAKQGGRQPTLGTITRSVSQCFNVPESTLIARGKHHNEAREAALWLARQCSGLPLADLGAHFDGIAPSGGTMACQRVAKRMESSRELRQQVHDLQQQLNRRANSEL